MSLSPRVRILAAAGLVALLALAAGFVLLGGGESASSAPVKQIEPLHPVKKHVRVAAKARSQKATAASARRVRKAKRTSVIDGMPAALALALRAHQVVVVSLYTPRSSVDALATAEARQGASRAGAGFVTFNVADDRVAAPLASLLTGAPTPADRVLDGPAVLVFQRPKSLFVRFNGFADRDTVAQAAANAETLAR